MSGQFLTMDIDYCRKFGHRFQCAWSDKTPLKVSLICLDCTNTHPGKTAYVAYGVEIGSWGQRRRPREREEAEHE